MNTPTRCCTKCGNEFPATSEYFHRSNCHKSGLKPRCKLCIKNDAKVYYSQNRENILAYSATYSKTHRAVSAARNLRYYHKHKNDPEFKRRASESQKRTAAKYTDRVRERQRNYYKAHRAEARQRNRKSQWAKENPERNRQLKRVAEARRKARKQGKANTFQRSDWQYCLAYWQGCCAVCGRPAGLWHKLAADHWIPISSPECPGTIPGNILCLCHGLDGCNNQKGNRNPEEWLIERLGKRKVKEKLEEIRRYFDHIKSR